MFYEMRDWPVDLWKRALPLALGLTLMAGCAVGPSYVRPKAPEMKEWLEKEDPKVKSESADFGAWWTIFNDPILDTLMERPFRRTSPFASPVFEYSRQGHS